jgi:hypothetical protein
VHLFKKGAFDTTFAGGRPVGRDLPRKVVMSVLSFNAPFRRAANFREISVSCNSDKGPGITVIDHSNDTTGTGTSVKIEGSTEIKGNHLVHGSCVTVGDVFVGGILDANDIKLGTNAVGGYVLTSVDTTGSSIWLPSPHPSQWTSFGNNIYFNSTSGGNVGIGLISPNEQLHVDGNIRSNTNIITPTISSNINGLSLLPANGFVGIGSITPTQALDIDGTLRIRSAGNIMHALDTFLFPNIAGGNDTFTTVAAIQTLYNKTLDSATIFSSDVTGGLTVLSGTITGVPLPLLSGDVASKAYVDATGGGITVLPSVISMNVTDPANISPAPTIGNRYLIANVTTGQIAGGDWVGRTKHIAQYAGAPTTWDYTIPVQNDMVLVVAESAQFAYISNTSEWTLFSSSFHGSLGGLSADDHLQYALLSGRTGGQTIYGGISTTDDLVLLSTSAPSKGNVIITSADLLEKVGIGNSAPSHKLDVTGTGRITNSLAVGASAVGLNAALHINGVGDKTARITSTSLESATLELTDTLNGSSGGFIQYNGAAASIYNPTGFHIGVIENTSRQQVLSILDGSAGNFVGLSQLNPVDKLHITANVPDTSVSVRMTHTGTGHTLTDGLEVQMNGTIASIINHEANGELRFNINGSDKMTLLANGNVGIGTNTPTEILEILGNNPTILINAGDGSTTAKIILTGTNDNAMNISYNTVSNKTNFDMVVLGTTTTTPLTIAADPSRIGINVTDPQASLHVLGNIRMDYGYFQTTTGYNIYLPDPTTNMTLLSNTSGLSLDNAVLNNATLNGTTVVQYAKMNTIVAQNALNGLVLSNSTIETERVQILQDRVVIGNSSVDAVIVKAEQGVVGLFNSNPVATVDIGGSVKVRGDSSNVLTGTVDPDGTTTLKGVANSTLFTTEVLTGDRIQIGSEILTVVSILNDTVLTLNDIMTDVAATSATRLPYLLHVVNTSNMSEFVINDTGSVGIGQVAPLYPLHISKHNESDYSVRIENGISTIDLAHADNTGLSVNTGIAASGNNAIFSNTNYANILGIGNNGNIGIRDVVDSAINVNIKGNMLLNGGIRTKVTNISSDTILTDDYYTVVIDSLLANSAVTLSLPPVISNSGREYRIISRQIENVFINASGSDLIHISTDLSSVTINQLHGRLFLYSDGIDRWYSI